MSQLNMVAADGFTTNPPTRNGLTMPLFTHDMSFQFWKNKFIIFMYSVTHVDLVFRNEKIPDEPIQKAGQKDTSFYREHDRWNLLKENWTKGNQVLFTHLYTAVENHDRAKIVVEKIANEQDGQKALKNLETEFLTVDTSQNRVEDLKTQFQARKIKQNESLSDFLNAINKLRLDLKNLGFEINDEVILEKIKNGVASPDNDQFQDIQNLIIAADKPTLSDITAKLRRMDELMKLNKSNSTVNNDVVQLISTHSSSCSTYN
jgi:hypothetical protein